MNTAQKNDQFVQPSDVAECVSALVDGEIHEVEIQAVLETGHDLHDRWHRYQLVGEVLRSGEPGVSLRSSQVFLAGVMAGLSEDPPVRLSLAPDETVIHMHAPPANDSVMRWKALAGVASVTAIMAVSWSILNGVMVDHRNAISASSQQASANSAALASLNSLDPVTLKIDQGTLIRDARLEQLLAKHRQYGGASALQMPAGFLRNATFEAAPRR